MKCEVEECRSAVAHGEHWYDRKRYWCAEHTPWSGHWEHCDASCLVPQGQRKVNELVTLLQSLGLGERVLVFNEFCTACGVKNPRCQCENDE